MTGRGSGALAAGGAAGGGEGGARATVGAPSREPIRRDEARQAIERLKAEWPHAFVAAEKPYRHFMAAEGIARND